MKPNKYLKYYPKYFYLCTYLLPLFLSIVLIFSSFNLQEDSNKIKLEPIKQTFAVTEYYINHVEDNRDNKNPVANIIQTSSENKFSLIKTDLEGGTFKSVKDFILNSLPQNKSLRPITVKLKKLQILESQLGDNRINGTIELVLDFYIEKPQGNESIHLLTYKGGGKYQRPINHQSVIEQGVQKTFSNSLKNFNDFINKEADTNIKLAKSFKLSFTEYSKNHEDTLYYSTSRPLKYEDFRGTLSSSKYAAYVFTGFGMEEKASIDKGILHSILELRVSVAKSGSWMNQNNKNSYVLNHEQRHFDIAKILSEKFKEDLRKETLTVDNYQGILNVQYYETLRETYSMQKKYDDETNHGLNVSIQAKWNKFIDEQLVKYKVKR